MEIQPDFRDLLALFDRNGVECLIVGAYALARKKDLADFEAIGAE